MILHAAWFQTKLGPMIAISDQHALYVLDFFDRSKIDQLIIQAATHVNAQIIPGLSAPILSVAQELKEYFAGTLNTFATPVHLTGTEFQESAWQELLRVPYGATRSYKEQSIALHKGTAFRAVANANGANKLSIIIPCHRIISSDGTLGGYGGGIQRKKFLLDHEKLMK